MKKNLFILLFAVIFIFTLSASDIPFLKSLFIGDEEYVRQQILKNCKDVESVELLPRASNENDDIYYIHVYLADNRYIQFAGQLHRFISDSSSRFPFCILQVNDLCPIDHKFEVGYHDYDYINYIAMEYFVYIKLLKKIVPQLKLNNMLDVVNNIDDIYSFISDLPELPAENLICSFDYEYNKSLETQIPEEAKNDVPFLLIEKKEHKRGTYEEGYKFYKMSVDRAVKENGYGNLKFKHEKP